MYPQLCNPSQTRIVHLQPASTISHLEARLEVVDLDATTRTRYNALSYCCGDRTPVSQIYITNIGISLSIGRNLTDALTRLLKDGTPCPFWIDAISIDQTDTEERNHQVRLMTRIFAGAEEVLMWLGSDDGSLQSALLLIASWANPCNDIEKSMDAFAEGSNQPQTFDAAEHTQELAKRMTPKGWAVLRAFFGRPYFRRAWIVQEVSVGRKLRICFGYCIPLAFEILHCAAWWLSHHTTRSLFEDEHGLLRAVVDSRRVTSLHTMRKHFQDNGGVPLSLLRTAYLHESYDVRDKFFAICGIYELPAHVAHHFKVEYGRPVWHVCAEAVKGIIKASESLHVLTVTNWPIPPNDSFPSWVPRFDGEADNFNWDPDTNAWTSEKIGTSKIPDARPGSSPCLRDVDDPHVLSLHGVKYTHRVVQTKSLCPPGFGESRDGTRQWEWFRWPVALVYLLVRPLPLWTSNKREIAIAFAECTTMKYRCGRELRQYSNDGTTIFADFRAYLQLWLDYVMPKPTLTQELRDLWKELMVDLEAWNREDTDADGNLEQEQMLPADPKRYHTAMIQCCGRRSLFITEDGKFGLGPAETQEGDEIVFFAGAARPFVLRPEQTGEHWRLIGSTWMHDCAEADLKGNVEKEERYFDLV